MTYGLTKAQRHCLLVIQELTALDGVPPTLSEIAHEMSLASRGRVNILLNNLRVRGFINWLPHHRRSIAILKTIPMPADDEIIGFFA